MIDANDELLRHLHPSHYNTDKTSGEIIISSEAFRPHPESNAVSTEIERLYADAGYTVSDRLIASNRKEYGALKVSVTAINEVGANAVYDPLPEEHDFGPNPYHSLISGFAGLGRGAQKKLKKKLRDASSLVLEPGTL